MIHYIWGETFADDESNESMASILGRKSDSANVVSIFVFILSW